MDIAEAIKYITENSESLGKYSDKLRNAIYDIDKHLTPIFKNAGIIYTAKNFFHEDEEFHYYLKVGKTRDGLWGILYAVDEDFVGEEIVDAPRRFIKDAIPVLPAFLEAYSVFLNKKTEEYKVISEIAESMRIAVEEALKKEEDPKA